MRADKMLHLKWRRSPIRGRAGVFERCAERGMKRLLVVDDALFMRRLIGGVAAEAGWEVVGEAGDGAEGVSLYDKLRPDLVTMDLVMPNMGGIEALQKIRELDPAARVVVITAVDQKQSVMDAIRLGAIDFIVKPFDRDRVASLLRKVAGREGRPPDA